MERYYHVGMSSTIKSLLVCPVTKQNLFPLDHDKTEVLLNAFSEKALLYMDGSKLKTDSGSLQFLMTENRHHVYSVIDGIPILLEAKQIDLGRLESV